MVDLPGGRNVFNLRPNATSLGGFYGGGADKAGGTKRLYLDLSQVPEPQAKWAVSASGTSLMGVSDKRIRTVSRNSAGQPDRMLMADR